MFEVVNRVGVTEINVIGGIGDAFFDETKAGSTLNSIESFLEVLNTTKGEIQLNIASLGGDLNEAFAIYDMLKAYPSRVITNFIAPTGSAGYVVGMGGDYIKSSSNALQLGHRAMLRVVGNSEQLRNAANTLDTYDSKLVSIYKKQSGKGDDEVYNWLRQDKWITPEEAKDFGLIHEIYKPKKVLNALEIEELETIHELPQNFKNPAMENTNDSTIKNSILNLLGVKNDASLKAENEALKEEIAKLKANPTNSVDVTPFTAEIETLKGEVSNKATEFDKLKAELDALKVTNEATEAELAKYKAGEVENNGTDPANPIVENATTEAKPLRFQPTSDFAKQAILNSKIKNSVIN